MGHPDLNAVLNCYAQRRLNPFLGVTQVAEGEGARALSINGRVWEIQALAERPDHTWRSHFSETALVEQYFTFGLWDAEDGLSRVPANPLLNIGDMSAATEVLTTALADCIDKLPFTLVDRFECWALDREGQAVALLASARLREHTEFMPIGNWQAATLSDHRFRSTSLDAAGITTDGPQGPRHHAGYLESAVRRRSSGHAWFERTHDGGARRLDGNPAIPGDGFPPLGLSTGWEDALTAEAVTDYLAWAAPRLLTLQDLPSGLRADLERQAVRDAREVARHYPLIPEAVDPAALQAARVEARLRAAEQAPGGTGLV